MCGRGRCSLQPEDVARRTGVPPDRWRDRDRYQPSYNVAPGFWIPVLRRSDANTVLHSMKWGLVPSFAAKGSSGHPVTQYRMINARSERVKQSPVFRRLLKTKRCVVVMNGFYEWHKETARKKQPYYIHTGEDKIVRLAALYDVWHSTPVTSSVDLELPANVSEALYTVTIITTDASRKLRWMHDRMPVMLPDDFSVNMWLGEDKEWNQLEHLLQPYNGEDVLYHPVTTKMGSVAFQEKESCLDLRRGGLDTFLSANSSAVEKHKAKIEERELKPQMPATKKIKTEVKTETTTANTKIKVKAEAMPGVIKTKVKKEVLSVDRTKAKVKKLARKAEEIEDADSSVHSRKVAKKEGSAFQDTRNADYRKRLRSTQESEIPTRKSMRLNKKVNDET